jgi:hypothetical protein
MTGSAKPRRRSQARRRARRTPASDPAHDSAAASATEVARPIDAANLDEAFVKALEADFIAHGAKAIAALRDNKPTDYVKIVAALRAKDAGGAVDPLREMTDAELDRQIEELARRAGFEIRAAVGADGEDAAPDEGPDAD